MRIISVGNFGHAVAVDDTDYDWLNQWVWTFDGTNGYVHRNQYSSGKKSKVYMHRLIMDNPIGMQVDHINGNKLDNRRSNLRIVTGNQNRANVRARGIYWHKAAQKWCVQIMFEGKKHYLGLFTTEQDALNAYKIAVKNIKGEFAR